MIPTANPYRSILRREYPEPLIALMAFILGIWVWDHYFSQNLGYAPGTEQVALVKIDRDLRLADAMAADPEWLRWLADVEQPGEARRGALEVLQKLAVDKSISPAGLEAFAVVKAAQHGLPLAQGSTGALPRQQVAEIQEASRELASHRGTWWRARWLGAWDAGKFSKSGWRQAYAEDGARLRTRAIAARSAVWLIAVIGLGFIPVTLCRLKQGLRAEPQGYGGAWPLPLGLVIFLVATLAWIGFTMTLELGIAAVPGLPPVLGIFLDSAARLLPALIAVALIFRHPRHAVRVMGIKPPVGWKLVLGMFSLLTLVDIVLRAALGGVHHEPGGGLSPGEAGLWGLAFTIISACLVAPVTEETLYRGVLFRACWNRLGVLPGAALSAVVFAVVHFYDGYGLLSVGIFGFSCALLYASTRSLATVIALHMFYNCAIKLPAWLIYHAPLG